MLATMILLVLVAYVAYRAGQAGPHDYDNCTDGKCFYCTPSAS